MLADSRLRDKQYLCSLAEAQVGSNFHKNTVSEGDHTAKIGNRYKRKLYRKVWFALARLRFFPRYIMARCHFPGNPTGGRGRRGPAGGGGRGGPGRAERGRGEGG